MRFLAVLPLALLLTGCLAPGERDPTRYPWDPRNRPALTPQPPVVARGLVPPLANPIPPVTPPQGSYCVIALEPQPRNGIVVGGKAPGIIACSAPAGPARKREAPAPQTSR